MAVFTAVNESQLAEWMSHYDLGDVVEFRGISSGIENSNFFLTTTRGEYVLTIFEKLTAEQLPFYLDLMRHLAAHRVPVPDPMPRLDGVLFGMPDKVKVALNLPTQTSISYPIAQVEDSHHAADAQAFIDFVLSPAGQVVLAKYGFKPAH